MKSCEVCERVTWGWRASHLGLAKMPIYKGFTEFLKLEGDTFDTIFRPRATTPFSGIYRCTVCGWEEVSVARTTCRLKTTTRTRPA